MKRHIETLLWLMFEKHYRFTLAVILFAAMVALVILTGGCARYGGTNVGVQTVSPFNESIVKDADRDRIERELKREGLKAHDERRHGTA